MKRFLLSLVALAFLSCSAEAACGDGSSACFWIGGGANSNWNTTGNWSNTSGGASSGTTPATGDSICFGSANNNDSTLNASRSILSINTAGGCTGGSGSPYTGTITHNSSVTLTVTGNDASANGGTTFLLSSSSGWTAASPSTSAVTFTATSGTSTITPNSSGASRNFGPMTLNGSGGTFRLGSDLTGNASSTLTLTAGTWDNNGNNVSYGAISGSGSTARTVSNATGSWTLTGPGGIDFSTVTNFSNFSTAFSSLTVHYSYNSVQTRLLSFGGATTVGTITVDGASAGGDISITGAPSATMTITNLNVTAPNRIVFPGNSARTYTITNAVSLSGSPGNYISIFNASNTPTINGSFTGSYVAVGGISWGTGTQAFTNCWDFGANSGAGFSCAAPSAGGGGNFIIGG